MGWMMSPRTLRPHAIGTYFLTVRCAPITIITICLCYVNLTSAATGESVKVALPCKVRFRARKKNPPTTKEGTCTQLTARGSPYVRMRALSLPLIPENNVIEYYDSMYSALCMIRPL